MDRSYANIEGIFRLRLHASIYVYIEVIDRSRLSVSADQRPCTFNSPIQCNAPLHVYVHVYRAAPHARAHAFGRASACAPARAHSHAHARACARECAKCVSVREHKPGRTNAPDKNKKKQVNRFPIPQALLPMTFLTLSGATSGALGSSCFRQRPRSPGCLTYGPPAA